MHISSTTAWIYRPSISACSSGLRGWFKLSLVAEVGELETPCPYNRGKWRCPEMGLRQVAGRFGGHTLSPTAWVDEVSKYTCLSSSYRHSKLSCVQATDEAAEIRPIQSKTARMGPHRLRIEKTYFDVYTDLNTFSLVGFLFSSCSPGADEHFEP